MRRPVIHLAEAATGRLPVPGGGGTYRILIDEPTTGARGFSLLLKEIPPGGAGREHAHDVEHGMSVIRDRERFTLEGGAGGDSPLRGRSTRLDRGPQLLSLRMPATVWRARTTNRSSMG
jgi:hypothetical protein